ncbi:hypothetical protein VNI00_006806 [Paramarasmius palmivorus]|uniref:Uncharacterized protein n=1 Tax=Paramarasmius palmivorus TaxID=297713 RepID=A0AAW0D9R4_9AGAR
MENPHEAVHSVDEDSGGTIKSTGPEYENVEIISLLSADREYITQLETENNALKARIHELERKKADSDAKIIKLQEKLDKANESRQKARQILDDKLAQLSLKKRHMKYGSQESSTSQESERESGRVSIEKVGGVV